MDFIHRGKPQVGLKGEALRVRFYKVLLAGWGVGQWAEEGPVAMER